MKSKEQIVYQAWRDSESYQVPMTEEGEKLAQARYHGFKKGWAYAQFYAKHGHIYMKDHREDEDEI